MDQRSTFLIELLDKLGVPLMQAVQAYPPEADASGKRNPLPGVKEAEALAILLGQSVQLGLSLAQKLDLKPDEGDPDAVRLALSAMAGRLVAGSYRQSGRIPAEAETARLSRALEAVLTFADNFTPSAEHSARLQLSGAEKPLFDMAQSHIFYLNAMEPVLDAIAEFPFGQTETKLIQDTAEKLQQRAGNLRETLIGAAADGPESAFAELMVLHSLARIYAECHRSETRRLLSADQETGSGAVSLDPVWRAFDLRLAMLETLLNTAVPGGRQASQQAAPAVAAPIQTPPPAAPSAPPPGSPMGFFTQKPQNSAPPASEPAQQSPAPAAGGGNPMAFFKPGAKKEEGSGS